MKHSANKILVLLLFALPLGLRAQPLFSPTAKYVVEGKSSLKVLVATNVNKFACQTFSLQLKDTLLLKPSNVVRLQLDVSCFDCNNAYLTKEFKKTLLMEKYPHIELSLFLATSQAIGKDSVYSSVQIELAGVRRYFPIAYHISRQGKALSLVGKKDFLFTDFGLTPPQRLNGLIKTKNNIQVEFVLRLREI